MLLLNNNNKSPKNKEDKKLDDFCLFKPFLFIFFIYIKYRLYFPKSNFGKEKQYKNKSSEVM